MNPFKIGDKVKQISSGWATAPDDNGKESIVIDVMGNNIQIDDTDFCYKVSNCSRGYQAFELITNKNKNNMNLKEKFITAFLSEPEKSFKKADITNSNGLLTEDGQNIFLSYLLKKEGGAFKTEVVDILLEEKE
jgi:hypothetical protein